LTEGGQARRLRRLALAALERYDLEVASVRFFARHSNSLFVVNTDDGERLILRVGVNGPAGHSRTQVESELTWSEALSRDTDLVLPEPIENRAGSPVTSLSVDGVPDERNVVVFRWLDGRISDKSISASAMRSIGILAAKLHRHGATFRPPPSFSALTYDRVFPYDEPVVLLDGDHDGLMPPARQAVFREARDQARAAINQLRRAEPMRVIHGDLHRWNVKIKRGVAAPFDFEDLLWGWPVQDIAITCYYQWSRGDFRSLNDAFRDGYETVAQWPERYPGEIDRLIAGRTLVIGNYVLIQPGLRPVAAETLDRGERRIRDLLTL
jgi:Ser/Thr protein kinase RdoA (MazF antagonist)